MCLHGGLPACGLDLFAAPLASYRWSLGIWPVPRAQFERALAVGEAALGPDHPTVATIRGNLGGVLGAIQEAPGEDLGRPSRNIGERWPI